MDTSIKEFIKDLLRKNFTIKTIKVRCDKQGYNVTDLEIAGIKHELELELKIERQNKKDGDKKSKVIKLFSEQESYFDFAKRLGVNTEYNDVTELISTVQKITADVFIRQSLVLMRALELQLEGDFIDTGLFIKGYEVALRGVCLAWGIQNLIDVNAAFQCLESKGFLNKNHALSQIPEILN